MPGRSPLGRRGSGSRPFGGVTRRKRSTLRPENCAPTALASPARKHASTTEKDWRDGTAGVPDPREREIDVNTVGRAVPGPVMYRPASADGSRPEPRMTRDEPILAWRDAPGRPRAEAIRPVIESCVTATPPARQGSRPVPRDERRARCDCGYTRATGSPPRVAGWAQRRSSYDRPGRVPARGRLAHSGGYGRSLHIVRARRALSENSEGRRRRLEAGYRPLPRGNRERAA